MRKLGLVLLGCMMVLLVASIAFADLDQFAGRWVNTDSNTRGVTTLDIRVNGNNVSVQAWGQCHPMDCDWGRVTGYGYAPNVSSNLNASARAVIANFRTNFSQTVMVLKLEGRELQADVYTRFTDGSNRSNYTDSYTFTRRQGPGHGPGHGPGNGPGNGPEDGPGHGPGYQRLDTPQQIAPRNGSVFNFYPRRTTLRWNSVPGASSYTVEIDCFHCCQNNAWCTDVGRTWKVVPGLSGTSYTFDFVGAQPGRWRVWAVGPGGRESAKSGWWEFKYTR